MGFPAENKTKDVHVTLFRMSTTLSFTWACITYDRGVEQIRTVLMSPVGDRFSSLRGDCWSGVPKSNVRLADGESDGVKARALDAVEGLRVDVVDGGVIDGVRCLLRDGSLRPGDCSKNQFDEKIFGGVVSLEDTSRKFIS